MDTLESLELKSEQALESKRQAFQEYVDKQKAKGDFNAKAFAKYNGFRFKNLTLKHKFAVAAKYVVIPAAVIAGATFLWPVYGLSTSIAVVATAELRARRNAKAEPAAGLGYRSYPEITIDSNGHLFKTPEKRKLFGKIKLPLL